MLALAYVVVGLATLTAFPLVWEDETWYTQSAWSFAEASDFTLPMFGDLAGFDRDNVVYGRFYLLVVAAVYRLADADPFTARLVAFCCGLVALAAVYAIGRELWNRRVGIGAAVILAVAPNFVRQTHDARPEAMLVAVWTTAFYLALSGERTGSRWRLLLAGVLASLAADTHVNGLVVPAAIFMALLVLRCGKRTLVTYLVGVMIGAIWWVSVHLVPDPDLFIEQVRTFGRGWPIVDVLAKPIVVFGVEGARYLFTERPAGALLVVLTSAAAVFLVVKRPDRAVISLLVFSGVVFVFMALFSGAKTPIYSLLLWPIAALLVARSLEVAPRPVAMATAGLVLVVSIASVGMTASQLWPADYDRYIAKLRAVIPADATVQAHPTVWFGFKDQPLIATHYFMWSGPYEEEVRRLGIDYVVVDELAVTPGCSTCRSSMPDEVRAFLAEHGELVAEVRDDYYGRVPSADGVGYVGRIYRVTE